MAVQKCYPFLSNIWFIGMLKRSNKVKAEEYSFGDIARLYDLLSMLLSVVVTAKRFLQNQVVVKLSWGRPQVGAVYSSLNYQNFTIARYQENSVTILHGFGDASTKAFTAVIYLSNTNADRVSHTSLIAGKKKILPTGGIRISRLEIDDSPSTLPILIAEQ